MVEHLLTSWRPLVLSPGGGGEKTGGEGREEGKCRHFGSTWHHGSDFYFSSYSTVNCGVLLAPIMTKGSDISSVHEILKGQETANLEKRRNHLTTVIMELKNFPQEGGWLGSRTQKEN